MLPSILKRAMILVVACLAAAGVIAFCAGVFWERGSEANKLKIGYTAEESRLTALAVSYVQGMESIKSLCSLEAVTEQEGKQLLQDGELSALIVLPQDVINEILSGSNTPATLYLPEKKNGAVSGGGLGAVGSMLFEELASAGIGMLGTAQAEIYASGAILQALSAQYGDGMFGDGILQSMYDDINLFNLKAAAGREKLFRTKTLSLTDNDTYAVYYGSAIFTIYGMLAGLFLGRFCKRSGLQQRMADRRIGVNYGVQLAARCLAGGVLMSVVLLLPFLVFLIPQIRRVLSVTVSLKGIASLLLVIMFMTIYYMAIYQMVERCESALVVIGVLAVLQSYLSGCLIPSVLLPKMVVSIGKCLPAAMVKKGFTILFTGDAQSFSYVAAGLCTWGLCLFLGTMLSMWIGEQDKQAEGTGRAIVKFHVPSLGTVMFRRLLYKKSMWFSLGFIIVLSAVILQVERNSETQIKVAVYDESGNYMEALRAYDGMVQFEQYESDAAVQRAVQKNEVECGYILPKNLVGDMTAMQADREILVYQDADAVAVPVVNEILFERIFRQVSLQWFEDYIAQNSVIKEIGVDQDQLRQMTRDCFDRELLEGTTFHFEIKRMEDRSKDADTDKRTVYPVYVAVVAAVVLCTLQGVLQVFTDIREQNFYKRNRLAVSVLTLILPVMLGLLCGLLIIMVAG